MTSHVSPDIHTHLMIMFIHTHHTPNAQTHLKIKSRLHDLSETREETYFDVINTIHVDHERVHFRP